MKSHAEFLARASDTVNEIADEIADEIAAIENTRSC
jgi:hypothetical protein